MQSEILTPTLSVSGAARKPRLKARSGLRSPLPGSVERWSAAMRRLSLAAVLVFPPAFAAHAQGDVTLFGQGDMQTMYEWSVPRGQFVAQPAWTPATGNPPLSISRAAGIAEAWIRNRNPEVKEFSISSIALAVSHTWDTETQDRWYYRVEFQPIVGGQRLFGGHFVAVVLFDGTVVEPRTERRIRP